MKVNSFGFSFLLSLVLSIGIAHGQDRGLDQQAHDVGNLLLPVTNYGIFGTVDSNQPSARWPGPGGVDHLRMGALWLGARIWGIPRTTASGTGVNMPMELQPGIRSSGGDSYLIYELAENYVTGDRYPHPHWDNDGDGREDEDPYDGLDNDEDGLVDEDGATISDQMLSCFYRDDLPECSDNSPYHFPLGIHVQQETYQWATPLLSDFVGLRFTVINDGSYTRGDFFLAWYADWRVLLDGLPGDEADDHIGYFDGPVILDNGETVDLSLAYAFEESGDLSSYAGIVVLDHPVDPSGMTAPQDVGIRSYRFFVPDLSFEDGGEPTNDEQMYSVISTPNIVTPPDSTADYRTTISSGPFQVSPGDSLTWQLALVAGATESELLANAAMAKILYHGQAFDRDGDPETGPDGREYVVHWWPHQILTEIPVESGNLFSVQNHPNPFNPTTEIAFTLPVASPVSLRIYDLSGRLVRSLVEEEGSYEGSHQVTWNGADDGGKQLASGVYLYRLTAGDFTETRKMTLLK